MLHSSLDYHAKTRQNIYLCLGKQKREEGHFGISNCMKHAVVRKLNVSESLQAR